MEAELRGDRVLRGTKIVLGNGEEWAVTSLPTGKKGKELIALGDALATDGEEDVEAQVTFAKVSTFFLAILQVNYPDLTAEEANEAGLFRIGMIEEFQQALYCHNSKKV